MSGFDHLVLVVADVRRTLAFYGQLGLAPERLAEWERGEVPFVSLRLDATTVIDLVESGAGGVGSAAPDAPGAFAASSAQASSAQASSAQASSAQASSAQVCSAQASSAPTASARNLDHLCLVLEEGTDLDALVSSGRFDVVAGPRRLWGARGWGEGVYVRDPDGTVVELRVYPSASCSAQ